MKTRQEMIYDFMVALASNHKVTYGKDELIDITPANYKEIAQEVYDLACALTHTVLDNSI